MYVVASDQQTAAARLQWAWDDQRRQQWALDQARAAQCLAELQAERTQLVSRIPPGVSDQLADARAQINLSEAEGPSRPDQRHVGDRLGQLEAAAAAADRRQFLQQHPEVVDRIRQIDREISEQRKSTRRVAAAITALENPTAARPHAPAPDTADR